MIRAFIAAVLRGVIFLLLVGRPELPAAEEIVFCAYNLRNYTDARPASPSSSEGVKAKTEREIAALIEIIGEIRPDILGVCEMGSREQLADFQKRLAAIGLEYPETELVEAVDTDRRLAMLSRFPIVRRDSKTDVSFTLNGRPEKVRRGFLDVTVRIGDDYELRVVGVHLKSRLAAPGGEALIRRHEVQRLRQHVTRILADKPDTNLLCYGDFNDTRDAPVYREIIGPQGSLEQLEDIIPEDEFGDRWTHYWREADQYSRIDYLFASRGLLPEIAKRRARIYRGPNWLVASDHRPLFVRITPEER